MPIIRKPSKDCEIVVENVTISKPRYEYLLRTEIILDTIKNLVKNVKKYQREDLILAILGIKDGDDNVTE